MKNIWAGPPGGEAEAPKRTRSWIKPTIAASLVILLGVGVGSLYASMKKSTAVGHNEVLAQFRADKSKAKADAPARKKAVKKEASSKHRRRASVRKSAGGSSAVAAGQASDGSSAQAPSSGQAATRKSEARSPQSQGVIAPPAEGVYTWNIEGYEEAPGVRRDLPKRSHRVITHQGNNKWVEHHIFSEQREQWLTLGINKEGVFTLKVRNKVKMGVTIDRTITMDPPMFVSIFPFKLGQTWKGSWEGKTSGSYTARTFEEGHMTVGGERVEIYATEVVMEMHGEVEGEATVRSWVAPEYRLVVKQYQENYVETGPGEYHSEWQGEVTSLHPER